MAGFTSCKGKIMNAITKTESSALAVQQPAGPMAAAIQALQAGMTVEQMQVLMGLQIDWEKNEARKAYVADKIGRASCRERV